MSTVPRTAAAAASEAAVADWPGTVLAEAPPDLEDASAEEVVAHMVERFHPRLYVAASFQKETAVMMDMVLGVEPEARFFTLDTGVLFPETYADLARDGASLRRGGGRVPGHEPRPPGGARGRPALGA